MTSQSPKRGRGEGRKKKFRTAFSEREPVLPHAQLCFFPVGRLCSSQACDKMLRSQFFVSPDGESSRIPVRDGGGEQQSAPTVESALEKPKVFCSLLLEIFAFSCWGSQSALIFQIVLIWGVSGAASHDWFQKAIYPGNRYRIRILIKINK